MQIEESFEQPENALLSISEIFEPNSKLTTERFEH
jgi:hypothetical protein